MKFESLKNEVVLMTLKWRLKSSDSLNFYEFLKFESLENGGANHLIHKILLNF